AQRPSAYSTLPIEDDGIELPGPALQSFLSTAFLPVTPIVPIGDDESKLPGPALRNSFAYQLQHHGEMMAIMSLLHLENVQPNTQWNNVSLTGDSPSKTSTYRFVPLG
ncbi:hypothetical protein CCMA1212_001155, partial [Trichoderma ghanense]